MGLVKDDGLVRLKFDVLCKLNVQMRLIPANHDIMPLLALLDRLFDCQWSSLQHIATNDTTARGGIGLRRLWDRRR